MSKLDRFFVSENLTSMCPNITAITLERFISDHRPILLREVRFNYGPTPFRFYRYWLDIDGFDKLVSDSWNMAPVNKKNAIRNFMEELRACDEAIDKGDYSNEVVHKRTEILNKIHQVSKFQASKIAQKAKIKWAIEGDENVKFFHDVFEAVEYFFMYGDIPNGCNSNFIALIPKILDANMVKDFRPISLIGSLYKIIAKILANRLVGVLGDIVNEVQYAFVVDRQILDGPFILDEVLHWCQDGLVRIAAAKLGCLILKTPFIYLGTKVGGNMSRKQSWKEVVDKVLSRLSRWKMDLLSIGDDNLNKVSSGGVRTCWSSIVQEVRALQGCGINVTDFIRLKLGNGDNMHFWIDNWRTTLLPCEDRFVWTLEGDGVFSVASIRKKIDGNRFQDVCLPTRWVNSVPIKVNITAWKVKSNAFPTRFNISRRGMDIDSMVCPICNTGVETTNHIFFQCVVVRQIMRKISSWWNIDYSNVNSYEEWRVWLVSIRIQS
nr:RNA-directed DNA polymerase, eukaryota [Tanacetum cinerariifolium]